ncbi:MAG TPA: YncE family protein, partial [Terriglobales bacterium]|nr:YncE family protein [Terriglobales bacterium]
LGGEAGNNQYDPVSHHVLVNVQTLDQLVEVDAGTNRIIRQYPLPGCDSNHGLLIAPEKRLAFIACERNAKLLVFDLRSKRVVREDAVGHAPDVLAFDSATGHLYVASESGVISVFRLGAKTLIKEGEGRVAARAHSILVDRRTHLVYLPLENVNGRPVLRIMKHS